MAKNPIKFPLKVLQPIRVYLLKRETDLRKSKKRLEKEDPFNDSSRLNDNAAIDAEAAEEVGHERITTLKKEIDKTLIRIRQALTRIKLGSYGSCGKCGKLINTDRLAIDPAAELCVKCAEKAKSK